jgi:predicted TIM-barrel fold metal-dependent hydrolase
MPPKIIDIHSHVFNAAYLPWQGVIIAAVGRKLWWVIDKLVRAIPGSYTIEQVLAASSADLAGRMDLTELDLDRVAPLLGRLSGSTKMPARFVGEAGEKAAVRLIEEFLELPVEERGDGTYAIAGPRKWGRKILQIVKWVWMLLRKTPREIAGTLRRAFPEVSLFVHLMMDMENHYPSKPPKIGSIKVQVETLFHELQVEPLRFLVFVAWDPFRSQPEFQGVDGSAMEIIEHAIGRGCAGIKFYPPNGYAADQNETLRLAKDAPDGHLLNEANRQLFTYCIGKGVPILAHSQPGELQAHEGFAEFSHPKYWATVLKQPEFAQLRLCFGHAGSDDWFSDLSDDDFDKSWAGQIVQLCQDHDNVYCDFGALTELYDQKRRSIFIERMKKVLAAKPKFGRRVVYGSDWSMIYLDPDHSQYLHFFDKMVAEINQGAIRLDPDRFFRGNAVELLNVTGYLERNAGRIFEPLKKTLEDVLVP